jgi:selenocysteine-specific elongation factor
MTGPEASPPLTVGTAGHIDHGKTALIAALTGVDTDRLPEEKARGISIALGYAPLRLPSGRRVSVVDVPGHERFVRTMVAGATGIDLYLMVVAADDGVMPQTIEHAAVLAALGVTEGVVAITKADIAEPDLAAQAARELMGDVEVIPCSGRTRMGVPDVAAALDRAAARVASRAEGGGEALLHVDRSFTIRGAGTVVTGTLWSGSVARGDVLTLLPRDVPVRVRGVQVHDEAVERAEAGQRVALNLAGVGVDELHRGDVVAARGSALAPTFRVDAALALDGGDRPVEHGVRVQVHHGTREAPARLASLGDGLWQLRLERPVLARRGDRVVIRSVAPPDTLGGGIVLEPHAHRHGPRPDFVDRLERLRRGEPEAEPAPEPTAGTSGSATATGSEPGAAAAATGPQLSAAALALEEHLRAAGHEPPSEADLGDAAAEIPALREAGRAVRVGRSMYAHPDAIADVRDRVVAIVESEGAITLARLRDELHTSRKFAQALLEHLDAARVTRRRPDDSRILSRHAR